MNASEKNFLSQSESTIDELMKASAGDRCGGFVRPCP